MSAAHALRNLQEQIKNHKLPGYHIAIPILVLKFQFLLTPAELRFVLVLFMKRNWEIGPVTITEKDWADSSDMNARSKANAIRGLIAKGLLIISGRGEATLYGYDPKGWARYTSQAVRTEKAHTAGRVVGAAAKARQQELHPTCQSKGCALLCGPSSESSSDKEKAKMISIVKSTKDGQFRKPVSEDSTARGSSDKLEYNPSIDRTEAGKLPAGVGKITDAQFSGESENRSAKEQKAKTVSLITATKTTEFRKPVSNTTAISLANLPPHSELETVWPLTLAALRQCIPVVGPAFLARLLQSSRAFAGLTDPELATAVQLAFKPRRDYQQSAGLFLSTVPEALADARNHGRVPGITMPVVDEDQERMARESFLRAHPVMIKSFQENKYLERSGFQEFAIETLDRFAIDLRCDYRPGGFEEQWQSIIRLEESLLLPLLNELGPDGNEILSKAIKTDARFRGSDYDLRVWQRSLAEKIWGLVGLLMPSNFYEYEPRPE